MLIVSQTARQATVVALLQPLSACQLKHLAEGINKVTETGIEPAIFQLQGRHHILSATKLRVINKTTFNFGHN